MVTLLVEISAEEMPFCDLSKQINITGSKETINEEDSKYFYFDIEDYDKVKIKNQQKESNFIITGDFGLIRKISADQIEEYEAKQISIHIPPEHQINGLGDLEVMIHHEGNKKTLILSFLFSKSKSDSIESSSRMFFSDLIDSKKQSEEIDPIDISGGFYEIKEFYYSDKNSYGCNDAEWVISKEVQYISKGDYDDIKEFYIEDRDKKGSVELKDYYDLYSGEQDDLSLFLMISLGIFIL
jgi:carbonic anhydrase